MKKLSLFLLFFFLFCSLSFAVTVSNVEILELGGDGFVVGWNTDIPTTGQVLYGTSGSLGKGSSIQTSRMTEHQIQVNGLDEGTVYFYRVIGSDTNSNSYSSLISLTRTYGVSTPIENTPSTSTSFQTPTKVGDRNYDIGDCRVGDGCMKMLDSCYDSRYPDMKIWATAGVEGGIPKNLPVKRTLNPGTNNIQAGIDAVANAGGGVLLLNSGTYRVTEQIKLKDNVVLRGVDKNKVTLEVTRRLIQSEGNKANAGTILFDNEVEYAGVEDLTYYYRVDGCEPPDKWSLPANELKFANIYVKDTCGMNHHVWAFTIMDNAKNNWIDNVNLIETGSGPLRMWGDHNTIRDMYINRSYNKYGSTGYFAVTGENNLIYNNGIYGIRHVLLDNYGGNRIERYNVFIGNDMTVDVNFHHGGNGHDLAEYNTLYPPFTHHRTGQVLQTGHPPSGHLPPGPKNVFYNNDASKAGTTLWGEKGVIYEPQGLAQDILEIRNAEPKCKTFYPMIPA